MTSAKDPETRQHHRAQVISDDVAAKFATSRRLAKQSNSKYCAVYAIDVDCGLMRVQTQIRNIWLG